MSQKTLEHQMGRIQNKQANKGRCETAICLNNDKEKTWTYIGHVLRMNNNRIPLQALKWVPEGKRRRGRPRETLRRTIIREGTTMGLNNIQELQRVASHRSNWRALVSALCTVFGAERT